MFKVCIWDKFALIKDFSAYYIKLILLNWIKP